MSKKWTSKGHHQLALTLNYYGSISTVSVKLSWNLWFFKIFLEVVKTNLTWYALYYTIILHSIFILLHYLHFTTFISIPIHYIHFHIHYPTHLTIIPYAIFHFIFHVPYHINPNFLKHKDKKWKAQISNSSWTYKSNKG